MLRYEGVVTQKSRREPSLDRACGRFFSDARGRSVRRAHPPMPSQGGRDATRRSSEDGDRGAGAAAIAGVSELVRMSGGPRRNSTDRALASEALKRRLLELSELALDDGGEEEVAERAPADGSERGPADDVGAGADADMDADGLSAAVGGSFADSGVQPRGEVDCVAAGRSFAL